MDPFPPEQCFRRLKRQVLFLRIFSVLFQRVPGVSTKTLSWQIEKAFIFERLG